MSISLDISKQLDEFSLNVAFEVGNETLGLLGASGSGKSMTLRMIAGLDKPDAGKIIVNGVTFFDSAAKINLSPQKRKSAILFQNYSLFPNLTVAQNISACLPKGLRKQEVHEIVKAQLDRFGMTGFGKRYPSTLSGGQQQRVALSRMLASTPSVMMLDEPFSALDEYLKSTLESGLLDIFAAFAGTVLYVSHDIDEAFRFCNRIAVMSEGEIKQVCQPAGLITTPTSLASLKASGVKNITPARKIGHKKVLAPEWNVELHTAKNTPETLSYLGIRATEVEVLPSNSNGSNKNSKATNNSKNTIKGTVVQMMDSRFERTIFVDIQQGAGQMKSSAIFPTKNIIQARVYKNASGSVEYAPGDKVYVILPPECIHLI